MQDESLIKAQQAAYAKHNYQKKHFEQHTSETHSNKKKPARSRQKKTNQSASGLLNFKYQAKEHIETRVTRPVPQSNTDITLSPYYRFAVSPGNYSIYHCDPNTVIPWDLVKKLTVLTDSEVKCPICLETELLVGRANKCGHCYCWPCIIRYM